MPALTLRSGLRTPVDKAHRPHAHRLMFRSHLRFFALLLVVAVATVLPAAPAGECENCQTVAVLDFSRSERVVEYRDDCRNPQERLKKVETEKDRRGWWFSSNDIYTNANQGRIAADIFTDIIRSEQIMKPVSRPDLRVFYADKKDLIKAKFPKMTDEELSDAMVKLSPVDVGRELGVDKVVVGNICDSEMRHNRAWGYFASAVTFNVAVYDVKSGRVDFQASYGQVAGRTSQYGVFENEAARFTRDWQRFLTSNYQPGPRPIQRLP
jgi:hypothetical protein